MHDASPSKNQRQLEIAHWVSIYSKRLRGIDLGEPTLNDDGSADSLFDVRFDSPVSPVRPVALEVTSIVDRSFTEQARVAHRVAADLTNVAVGQGLGRWYVEVLAGTRLRPIKDAILQVITGGGQPPDGVLGVWQAKEGEPGVVIGTRSSRAASSLPGFSYELQEAIDANRRKLARADRYERHLAVDLRALRSSNPSESPPPRLPDEIDVLWVLRTGVTVARTEPMAWWSTGGEWSLSHDWEL